MDILVTVNRAYLYPLSVMLKSLACQHPGRPIRVFVLHRTLLPQDFAALAQAVNEPALTLVPLPADQSLLPHAPTTDRYPMEMYDRIFAAFQLPQNLERVLYLDPDLVVNQPLEPLLELPLEDYFFAAASHVAKTMEKLNAIRLQSETPGPYINSGVLVMNLPVLRREQQIQPVLDYVDNHQKSLLLPDQDVISALYGSRLLRLNPWRYNMTERLLTASLLTWGHPVDLKWVQENSAIIHYCGRNKPWKPNYMGKLDCIWQKYADLVHFQPPKNEE